MTDASPASIAQAPDRLRERCFGATPVDASHHGSDTVRGTPPAALRDLIAVTIIGPDYFAVHALPATGTLAIGRGLDNDVVIDEASASRHHARLHTTPQLAIEDCGSANGTQVGDRTLAPGTVAPLAFDEVVRIGAVSLIVQRGHGATRSRRLWSYARFEARVQDECARAERFGVPFAVAHVRIEHAPAPAVAQQALAADLRPADVIGVYGPGEYEVLLPGAAPDGAAAIAAAVTASLAAHGAIARVGVACYPRDSRDPEALVACARGRARHDGRTAATTAVMVVRGERMVELHRLVSRVAGGDISVLLLGETGVGKEVIAEAIHAQSPRAGKPLLRLNCAALSESLLESELFGHERGAFTGALKAKPGLLESAQGGTVFLDEIGELPTAIQVKLLRVLEERKVTRVGGLEPCPIDVRFIAATHRALPDLIARGQFRADLYYRLDGISITIPPLRERPDEIEPLARELIGRCCRQARRFPEPTLSAAARKLLLRHAWPGNIRELRNAIERAVLLCTEASIRPEHLPQLEPVRRAPGPRPTARTTRAPAPAAVAPPPAAPDRAQQLIADALRQCGGNQTAAARLLGVSRRTLINRLDRLDLPRPRQGRTAPPRPAPIAATGDARSA